MLKITPYLGIFIPIVSIGGLWYPKLGYFMLFVMIIILITSPFLGRWFCGNLCPRGSYNDFWLSKISKKIPLPKFLKSLWIRIPIFILLMGGMVFRLSKTQGLVDKIGMVFVVMCLVTSLIATILGTLISPRAWCSFCPMGTMQKTMSHINKKIPKLSLDSNNCISCGKCVKTCPMHLPIIKELKNNTHKELHDCIKCGKCVKICPKYCLSLK